jgi:hypothetical protein
MVLVAAAAATLGALAQVGSGASEVVWGPLLAAGLLGLPLLFAITVLNESQAWRGSRAVATLGVGMAALVAIGLAWNGWTDAVRTVRFALFSVTFHLCASFFPYVGRAEGPAFWQFNKVLFLRALTTALYAVVLFAGLAAAIAAIDVLFAAKLDGDVYARLFIIVSIAFSTWFFVSGIPEPLASLEQRSDYPDGLRRFAQYLLIPLVAIYLVILTAYLGKVIVTRVWPSGWIGYLVSYVTISGMLAWLLVRPLEDRPEYRWVKAFTRGFYLALLPSIAMLWIALLKRTVQYGLTERRTIALAGALWLTGIALFYILSRSRSIKVIPTTLCLIAALLSAGPLGAVSLSVRNQRQRLERVLLSNGMMTSTRWQRATRSVSERDVIAINAGVSYLWHTLGPDAFRGVMPDSLVQRKDSIPTYINGGVQEDIGRLVDYLGVERRTDGGKALATDVSIDRGLLTPMEVSGFSYVTSVRSWAGYATRDTALEVGAGFRLRTAADSTAIEIIRDSTTILRVPLDSVFLEASRGVSRGPARPPWAFDAVGGGLRIRLLLTSANVRSAGKQGRLAGYTGYLLLDTTARTAFPR